MLACIHRGSHQIGGSCVVFDLDGTLADLTHRVHFVDGSPFTGAYVTFQESVGAVKKGSTGTIRKLSGPDIVIVEIRASKLRNVECRISAIKIQSDWDKFFDNLRDDQPIKTVVRLLDTLKHDHAIVICSGRPESHRPETVEWLARQSISYEALYLRNTGDSRDDVIVKRELLQKMRNDGYHPWVAVEDRNTVVQMWRDEGITCLQCADGDF